MKRARELRIRPGENGFQVDGDGYGNLVIAGDFITEEIDNNVYVQVEFLNPDSGWGYSKLYTYIDPGFNLGVGDVVNVPTVYKDDNIAIVRKLGDGYNGKARTEVKALFQQVKISPDGEAGYDDRIFYRESRNYACCGPEYGCFCNPATGDICS